MHVSVTSNLELDPFWLNGRELCYSPYAPHRCIVRALPTAIVTRKMGLGYKAHTCHVGLSNLGGIALCIARPVASIDGLSDGIATSESFCKPIVVILQDIFTECWWREASHPPIS